MYDQPLMSLLHPSPTPWPKYATTTKGHQLEGISHKIDLVSSGYALFYSIQSIVGWLWCPSLNTLCYRSAESFFFWQNLLCRHSSNWTNVTRRGLIRQQCAGSDQRDSGTKVEPMSRKSPTAQTNLALFKTSCETRFKSWKKLQLNVVFYNIFALFSIQGPTRWEGKHLNFYIIFELRSVGLVLLK